MRSVSTGPESLTMIDPTSVRCPPRIVSLLPRTLLPSQFFVHAYSSMPLGGVAVRLQRKLWRAAWRWCGNGSSGWRRAWSKRLADFPRLPRMRNASCIFSCSLTCVLCSAGTHVPDEGPFGRKLLLFQIALARGPTGRVNGVMPAEKHLSLAEVRYLLAWDVLRESVTGMVTDYGARSTWGD